MGEKPQPYPAHVDAHSKLSRREEALWRGVWAQLTHSALWDGSGFFCPVCGAPNALEDQITTIRHDKLSRWHQSVDSATVQLQINQWQCPKLSGVPCRVRLIRHISVEHIVTSKLRLQRRGDGSQWVPECSTGREHHENPASLDNKTVSQLHWQQAHHFTL